MTRQKNRRGPVMALVVLVLLVGSSTAGLLLSRDDQRNGEAGSAGPSAEPSMASAGDVGPTTAPPPLTEAPSGVTWELFQGVALPASASDGPTRVAGPVHAGFSRTPTGALLAAAQIGIRSVVDPSVADLRLIAQQQLVDGTGKTAWLNLLAQIEDNDPPAGGYAQLAGFRYLAYSPDLAVVSTATRDKTGRLQVGTDTLRWVEGDWRLEKPTSGLQQPQLVQDLAGYVPWSGVS